MAWTFNNNLSTTRDEVRLKIGDTNSARPEFEDETIDEVLSDNADNVNLSAADLLEAMATKYARDFNFSADGASFSKGSIAPLLRREAARLRRKAAGTRSVSVTRVDGYSDDVKNTDVDNANNSSNFDRSGLVN